MTGRRAALVGSSGALIMVALFALLAGISGWDSGSAEMLAYVVVLGALLKVLQGVK